MSIILYIQIMLFTVQILCIMSLEKNINMEGLKSVGNVVLAVAPPMIIYIKDLFTPMIALASAVVGLIYISHKLYNEIKITKKLRCEEKKRKENEQKD